MISNRGLRRIEVSGPIFDRNRPMSNPSINYVEVNAWILLVYHTNNLSLSCGPFSSILCFRTISSSHFQVSNDSIDDVQIMGV